MQIDRAMKRRRWRLSKSRPYGAENAQTFIE
jgi:hypothetical protein